MRETGGSNLPDTLLGGIAINEVLADPNGANNFDTDGNGVARGADEFVELINTSNTAIDISGLELWDAGRGNWFTFPPGTVLQPGATAIVVRNVQSGGSLPATSGDNLAFDADFGQGVINNGADNVVVYDPNNDEFVQVTYNGDTLDDPTSGSGYAGFSSTATRNGLGEDMGNDNDGFSMQRSWLTGDWVNDQTPTPGAQNVCFASGAMIETDRGPVAVENLQCGDLIKTKDRGLQPLRWVYAQPISTRQLSANPKMRPLIIQTASRGVLRVSRHHRLLVQGRVANRMFGAPQVLVAAKDLLALPQVYQDRSLQPFSYFHLVFDHHEILFANGIATESLLLGAQAEVAITPAALAELKLLMPHALEYPPACAIAQGAKARKLVQRHCKNKKPVLADCV